jgi:Bacterial membrane protein YfhO
MTSCDPQANTEQFSDQLDKPTARQPLDKLPGLRNPPAAERMLSGPHVWIYRLPGAMPRAVLYRLPERATGAPATNSRHDGDPSPDPRSADIELQAGHNGLISSPPTEAPGVVKIEQSSPSSVQLRTTSMMDSLLVLHDLYSPGWVAEIDGKSVAIRRAGPLFRAVFVPAGSHRITFRFEPFAPAALSALLPIWSTRRSTPP